MSWTEEDIKKLNAKRDSQKRSYADELSASLFKESEKGDPINLKGMEGTLSANKLTSYVIKLLEPHVTTVWRQNNYATRGRKFIGMEGLSDVIMVLKNGLWGAVEIKSGKDTITDAQVQFLMKVHTSGGIAHIVRTYKDAEDVKIKIIRKYETHSD